MIIRLTQIDGKLPNLALMKLAHWHRAKGDELVFTRSVYRDMFEPDYGRVYGSAIFETSAKKVEILRQQFPGAIVGGSFEDNAELTVESIIGCEMDEYENYDYSISPSDPVKKTGFLASIGFSQRGCRLGCGFCCVPKKEGKNRSVNSISEIWRGEPYPKHIHLLDNDFFGQPGWERHIDDIISGGFKMCFSQGINIRLIHQEGADALARIKFTDDSFTRRRIYTAWDNARDEKRFLAGVEMLINSGIRPDEIMVYFLCNYWSKGLTEDVLHRFDRMVKIGLKPYPMVYDATNADKELLKFQRFVIRGVYHSKETDFETFKRH